MARRKQTRGECVFCGKEMTRGGLARHLKTCEERLAAQERAKERPQTLYHLQVQDAWGGVYWLHLEMRGDATLNDLDEYLRAIWLECCGHLSAFTIGPVRYTQIFEDSMQIGIEKSMDIRVNRLFRPGMEIPYEYDFGTTSELVIKVVDERQGKPLSPRPIFLMARNHAPELACMECGQPATYICLDCMYEQNDEGCGLCDEHVDEHECGDEYGGPVAFVNSPRVGMCGYDGPAEPPY